MHRTIPISTLVYNALFPSPKPTDPPNFSAHLTKNLVGEVRIETATFYGSLDTIEARYPGLNYASGPHRKRLGRFPHHKRLFEAFDSLGLTESEIQGFCRWEGTLWARERYERDEGVKVLDTTGMEIGEWVDLRKTGGRRGEERRGINKTTDIEVEIAEIDPEDLDDIPTAAGQQHQQQQGSARAEAAQDTEMPDSADADADADADAASESSDDDDDDNAALSASVGFDLNARLMHAAALRDQGVNVPLDPAWEEFFKEAQEPGETPVDTRRRVIRTLRRLDQLSARSTQHRGAPLA